MIPSAPTASFKDFVNRGSRIEKILNMKYDSCDVSCTFREWFGVILKTLFDETEGFSGKRPLGNSGWDSEVAIHLAYLDPSIINEVYIYDEEKNEDVKIDISNLENIPLEEWPWYPCEIEDYHEFDFDEKKTQELFNEVVEHLLVPKYTEKEWETMVEMVDAMEICGDEIYEDDEHPIDDEGFPIDEGEG